MVKPQTGEKGDGGKPRHGAEPRTDIVLGVAALAQEGSYVCFGIGKAACKGSHDLLYRLGRTIRWGNALQQKAGIGAAKRIQILRAAVAVAVNGLGQHASLACIIVAYHAGGRDVEKM